MSKSLGRNLREERLPAPMIDLTAESRNTNRISAISESKTRLMTIGPVPVVSKLRAGPQSILEMIDTLSELAAENVRCPLADECMKAGQVPDLILMETTTLTVRSIRSNLEDTKARHMNLAFVVAVAAEVVNTTDTLRTWIRRMSQLSVRKSHMVDLLRIPEASIEAAKEVRERAPLVKSVPP